MHRSPFYQKWRTPIFSALAWTDRASGYTLEEDDEKCDSSAAFGVCGVCGLRVDAGPGSGLRSGGARLRCLERGRRHSVFHRRDRDRKGREQGNRRHRDGGSSSDGRCRIRRARRGRRKRRGRRAAGADGGRRVHAGRLRSRREMLCDPDGRHGVRPGAAADRLWLADLRFVSCTSGKWSCHLYERSVRHSLQRGVRALGLQVRSDEHGRRRRRDLGRRHRRGRHGDRWHAGVHRDGHVPLPAVQHRRSGRMLPAQPDLRLLMGAGFRLLLRSDGAASGVAEYTLSWKTRALASGPASRQLVDAQPPHENRPFQASSPSASSSSPSTDCPT